jgi:hypothetical protein
MGKEVHLINEVGHKIEVESSALADDELLNENKIPIMILMLSGIWLMDIVWQKMYLAG